MEAGETPEECLKREVQEETGYKLNSYEFRGLVIFNYNDDEPLFMYLYTSSDFSGNQHECDEGNLKWIPKKEIFDLKLWEGDKIFLELLLVTVVGNIDTIMLGYYSDEAVGAIGGITQLLNIQNTIFSFINMATSILCSQFLGAKDDKRVKEVISVSLVLNIGLGIILGGIYLFFWKGLLHKIHLPDELIGVGKYYFMMVGGLCLFQGIILYCGAVLKSHGRATEALMINVGVNILNIFGNALFIFGWLGMPVLGPTGVGISTVISRGIGCIVAFYMMCKYCNFTFRKKYIKPFPFKIVKNILDLLLYEKK